tara:strand:- start:2368 stop:3501 length:1134 start_codon:yes stop_codon:yes gene_type:complete
MNTLNINREFTPWKKNIPTALPADTELTAGTLDTQWINIDHLVNLTLWALIQDKGEPGYKESSIIQYGRQISKLYGFMWLDGMDLAASGPNNIPLIIGEGVAIIQMVEDGLDKIKFTERTIKNYYSLLLLLSRVGGYDAAYKQYRKNFDEIKGTIVSKEIKQEPSEKDKILEGLSIKILEGYLHHHYKKVMASKKTDEESARLYMLGFLHTSEALRNEASDMVLSDVYLTTDMDPKTNFIYCKGRNSKTMVIRNNKVRNPDRGDPPKEVKLSKKCNSAVNRYIETMKNLNKFESRMRLIPKHEGAKTESMSSSNYTYLFKKIWEHQKLELTSTSVRKLYAIDIRKEHKGKLTDEIAAAEKLDHSGAVHDQNYIIYFE